uniref:Uncharacterized protein n=1 Tax=Romanomermis culicivorax TaxID=13658 RepID=A0A915HRL7_ROMCU
MKAQIAEPSNMLIFLFWIRIWPKLPLLMRRFLVSWGRT